MVATKETYDFAAPRNMLVVAGEKQKANYRRGARQRKGDLKPVLSPSGGSQQRERRDAEHHGHERDGRPTGKRLSHLGSLESASAGAHTIALEFELSCH